MTFTPKAWQNCRKGGTPVDAAALIDLEVRVTDYTDQQIVELQHLLADPDLEQIQAWISTEMTDDRGERYPNGLRRWTRLSRPNGAPRIPGAVEAYLGQRETAAPALGVSVTETSDEDTDDVWVNSTAASLTTNYLARYSLYTGRTDMLPQVDSFARTLIRLMWQGVPVGTDKVLRRGGVMLGPPDSRTGAFNAGLVGTAMLNAYKATSSAAFLNAAVEIADYCMRLANPNTTWNAAYGFNPINPTVGGTTWHGFADRMDAVDKISTVNTTWNLTAARFLYDFGIFVGDDSYVQAAISARDFLAYGVLNGYDFFAVQTNLATAKLTAPIVGAVPGPATTVLSWTATGPPVAFPGSYPFNISFAGETMTVTGSPGAGQFTVTRGISGPARDYAAGAMFQIVDARMSASWTLSAAHVWNDHQWHRLGDALQVGTLGTDQVEYGIPALYAMGYDVQTLRDAYLHFTNLPHSGSLTGNGLPAAENASDGGAFGRAYDGRFCWTGYMRLGTSGINGRPDRMYGTYYDFQGAGTLGGFKAKEFPEHFALSRQHLVDTVYRGSLLNKDKETQWTVGAPDDVTKRGAIVVAGAGLALVNAAEGVV